MRRSAGLLFAAHLLVPGIALPPPAAAAQAEEGRAAADGLVPLPTLDHLDGLAREPMIVEREGGVLFVSGYGSGRPRLWRSPDAGATWEEVGVGSEDEGAVGNSDVDLAVGPDGTLYFIAMSFDRETLEGTGIAVGASPDGGSTWTWSSLSEDRFDDRPWVGVASDGTAHAVWNDGAGVSHAVSADGGRTWTERPRVHHEGGSSHMAVGPEGRIAVRLTPLSASGNRHHPGVDGVAVSTDGGASWTLRNLPGERAWSSTLDPEEALLRWVEPVAWDAAGALFALWSEGTTLWLARSADDGRTWERWRVIEEDVPLYFPYLAARGEGKLAATWFSGVGDDLRANLARIRVNGVDAAPRVERSEPFRVPAFRQPEGEAPPVRDTAGEYFPVLFLSDGRLAAVTTIQDPAGDRWGFTFRSWRVP